jgi:uncharacterized protein (TIGR02996 family)
MTHADEQAFMTAILAAPDDDTPRLVFADWLDERGGADDRARAALIRAQCRLEYLPAGRERTKLTAEVRGLLKRHAKPWTRGLSAVPTGRDWTFRRGFLDGGSMSPTAFVERGDDLFRLAPTLRALKFPNAANEVTELADSPFLARLAAVDLTLMCTCGWCSIDEELRDLFKSRYASNLKCLSISRDRLDAAGAAALARSKVLANLTELDLSRNPLEAAGVQALVRSKHLSKLTALDLSTTSLQNAGVEALAAAKHLPALARLNLSTNAILAAGVAALAASPLFRQLTALDLSHNRIGEAGAKALVGAAESKLESLDLRGTQLGPRATGWLKARFGKVVKL